MSRYVPAHARSGSVVRAVAGLAGAVAVGGVITTGFAPQANADPLDGAVTPIAVVATTDATASHMHHDQWLQRELRDIEAQRRAARARAARKTARSDRRATSNRLTGTCVVPTSGYTLTASFGEAGAYWSSGFHTGQDFSAAVGTPIVAVCDGTVAFAGWDGPYGNKVILTHADGTQTMYAHLLRLAVTGGPVHAGQIIGYLGGTGNVTGPHLHFEALLDGVAVDPIAWLHRHGVTP